MGLNFRAAAIGIAAALLSTAAPAPTTVRLTGWFSCNKCTAARIANGDIRPSNPVCAKDCIEKGDEAVFISEQRKESLKVRKYPGATEDLGYHVEVTGTLDPSTHTIAIESVKRLSYEGASCARPRKAEKK